MRRIRKLWWPIVIGVAVPAFLCVGAQGALGSRGSAGSELQAGGVPSAAHDTSAAEQKVDEIPIKHGIWETSVYRGTQVVYGPLRENMCPGSVQWNFFPSLPSTENLGRTLPEMIIGPDPVWRLADGRYRVKGGVRTTQAGSVRYGHLITLHGDDHYDDELTVTLQARTHPVKHVYSGSGHWVAPCPVKGK
jgi:hypothetical protein